jgi:hypothetical protein
MLRYIGLSLWIYTEQATLAIALAFMLAEALRV